MNTNIRKRRAYGHDEVPVEPSFYGLTYPPPLLNDVPLPLGHSYILDQSNQPYAFGPANQYVLEQAALILNRPVDALLDFSDHHQHQPQPRQQQQQQQQQQQHQQLQQPQPPQGRQKRPGDQYHFHKRPRLDTTTVEMPTSPYFSGIPTQHVQEKGTLDLRDADVDVDRKHHAFFSGTSIAPGWTGARLADCFASFSMCPPFEPQTTYQALPTPTPYGYSDHQPPMLDSAVVSVQPQAQASLLPTPITPNSTALFSCDDPSLTAEYLASYPPLQPDRPMGFQPAISPEEMVYPGAVPPVKYEDHAGRLQNAARPELQLPYLVDAPLSTGVMSGAYVAGVEPLPYDGNGMMMTLPSRFHPISCFDVESGTENGGNQDKPSGLELLPPHKTTPVKRGPFKDQDSREKTALTRKMGSCIRCRMQRIRCNLDPENEKGPCLTCKSIASSAKVYRLNCLRLKITDVKLFKPGQLKGQEWTNRWKDSVMDDIGTWDSGQVRTIQVTEGYTGQSVKLQVRQFKPQLGDKIKRSWVSRSGQKHEVQIPAFAIVNMDDAKAEFDQYIKIGLVDCCHRLLGSRDELLWRTYSLAINAARDPSTPQSERSLLISTLDLWMSVRLTTKSFEIVGDDTLGMPPNIINDHDNPLHGKIPLPPVMGAQIDSVIIHQIQPRLRRKALEELQKMTQEKKQKTWLTTYLVTFILLHNIALITKHDADYAKKHGLRTRFAREANVKEYNLGANTLLAYFHYCNKAIYPFSRECKDQDLQNLAELDDTAISFVHYTREQVVAHKKTWEELWANDNYEHEYYYVSQLFEPNWQPRTMV